MPPTGSSSSSRRAGARVPRGDAARELFALASAPTAIARASSTTWSRAMPGSLARRRGRPRGRRRARRCRSRPPSFVVFDLETTGSRLRVRGSSRSARSGSRRSSSERRSRRSSTRVCRCRPRSPRSPGSARRDLRQRPGRRSRRPPLPRVRRRGGARRAQRALRHRLSRSRGRAPHREAGGGAGRRHGLARAAAPGRPDAAVRPRPARPLLRHVGRAVSPCAARCRRDGGDPRRADRARAGARCRDGRRPRRAVGAARATTARQALARAGAPTTPGTYVFRDTHGQALYVGRARDLSARLRSYFSGERQRPAVEAALGALRSVEWRAMRERVRGCPGRAAAPARASPAGERSRHAARPAPLPPSSRRPLGVRAEPTTHGPLGGARAGAPRGTGARRLRRRRPGRCAPGASASPRPAGRQPPLRGRGPAARPDHRSRAGRRAHRGRSGSCGRCARVSSCPA